MVAILPADYSRSHLEYHLAQADPQEEIENGQGLPEGMKEGTEAEARNDGLVDKGIEVPLHHHIGLV